MKNVLYMDNAGGWLCCSCMAQVGMAGLLIRFGRQLAFELALLTYVLKHPPTNTHTLPTECAVAGEAAGLALGLLYAGSGTDKAAELLAYAHETQVRWASAAAWAGMRCSLLRCCLNWHALQRAALLLELACAAACCLVLLWLSSGGSYRQHIGSHAFMHAQRHRAAHFCLLFCLAHPPSMQHEAIIPRRDGCQGTVTVLQRPC